MLMGQYEHTLDIKGRMNMPAKFRDELGDHFVITKGTDACLSVYSQEEWKTLADRVKRLPEAKAKMLKRFFFANATEVEPDKQGRIIIPAVLRTYAQMDKEVIVVGVMDKAEIWDRTHWNETMSEMTPEAMSQEIVSLDDF